MTVIVSVRHAAPGCTPSSLIAEEPGGRTVFDGSGGDDTEVLVVEHFQRVDQALHDMLDN